MKVTIKRKYIYLNPTPLFDVKNGLVAAIFETEESSYCKPFVTADIHKGQVKYLKPYTEKQKFNTVKDCWVELTK